MREVRSKVASASSSSGHWDLREASLSSHRRGGSGAPTHWSLLLHNPAVSKPQLPSLRITRQHPACGQWSPLGYSVRDAVCTFQSLGLSAWVH